MFFSEVYYFCIGAQAECKKEIKVFPPYNIPLFLIRDRSHRDEKERKERISLQIDAIFPSFFWQTPLE